MTSILEHVASTTPSTDKEPVKIKFKVPRGNIYWGDAGLNGGYVQPQIEAFRKAGIKHIWVGLTNTATKVMGGEFGTIVDAIRAGLIIRYEVESSWTIESAPHALGRAQPGLIGKDADGLPVTLRMTSENTDEMLVMGWFSWLSEYKKSRR